MTGQSPEIAQVDAARQALRAAASSMLREHGEDHPRHAMWVSLAALLLMTSDGLDTPGHRIWHAPEAAALRAAHAYLDVTTPPGQGAPPTSQAGASAGEL